MSIQSIITKDIDLLKKENLIDIIKHGDNYMFYKRFALGCNVDKDAFEYDCDLYEVLHTENCDILKLLQSKIEGNILELNNKTLSAVSQYSISFEELYNRWLAQGNTGNFDFFLDVLINGGVTLEKNGW